MARLIAPNGVTVNVSDEKAERLLSLGYSVQKSRPRRKAAAKPATPTAVEGLDAGGDNAGESDDSDDAGA